MVWANATTAKEQRNIETAIANGDAIKGVKIGLNNAEICSSTVILKVIIIAENKDFNIILIKSFFDLIFPFIKSQMAFHIDFKDFRILLHRDLRWPPIFLKIWLIIVIMLSKTPKLAPLWKASSDFW